MKKLLTLFAFALVTFTVDAQSTQKGDINGDGDVSVNDVAMIVNYILGITDSNFIIANADVNDDGEIDINDVMGTVSIILEGNDDNDDNGGNGNGAGDTSRAYLTCPDNNHPHMIDLGLPSGTKWACCNVGTNTPEGYGGYYAWGETSEKAEYGVTDYQFVYPDNNGYWFENGTSYSCQNIGSDIAGTQYDVAHVQWGGSWVMPSYEQQKELRNNCTYYTWTTMNGIKGGQITGPSGGTIFLPAAGYLYYGELHANGSRYYTGYYWSSTQHPLYSYNAYAFEFGSYYTDFNGFGSNRCQGFTVRPVSR